MFVLFPSVGGSQLWLVWIRASLLASSWSSSLLYSLPLLPCPSSCSKRYPTHTILHHIHKGMNETQPFTVRWWDLMEPEHPHGLWDDEHGGIYRHAQVDNYLFSLLSVSFLPPFLLSSFPLISTPLPPNFFRYMVCIAPQGPALRRPRQSSPRASWPTRRSRQPPLLQPPTLPAEHSSNRSDWSTDTPRARPLSSICPIQAPERAGVSLPS